MANVSQEAVETSLAKLRGKFFEVTVLQSVHMGHTFTIRLTDELLVWLKEKSQLTGVPVGRLIREQLESAKAKGGEQKFMRHVGALSGPTDLSARKGYSRK